MPEIIQIKCDRCGTVSTITGGANPALCKVQVVDTTGAQTDSETFVLGPECFNARAQTILCIFPFSDIAVAALAQAQAAVAAGGPDTAAAQATVTLITTAQTQLTAGH